MTISRAPQPRNWLKSGPGASIVLLRQCFGDNWPAQRKGEVFIDPTRAETLYRTFSNVTHGKWTTFEAAAPDRFSHNISEWVAHLLRIEEVENLLLNVWRVRFPKHFVELMIRIPAIERLNQI